MSKIIVRYDTMKKIEKNNNLKVVGTVLINHMDLFYVIMLYEY